MFEDRRLTRISAGGHSRVRTPSGIRVGATAAQVRRAYGRKLQAEPHKYLAKAAEYLTYWTVPAKRGVVFETGENRRVQRIPRRRSEHRLCRGLRVGRPGRAVGLAQRGS